jgi:N-acetylglucosamine kinase-like BadF-type ATPase
MSVVVGVDGGGTRTRAVLIDERGRELGRAEYAGAVVTAREPGRAADAVTGAVRRAADRAGVELPVDAMWAGLAGAGDPAAREAVTAALRERALAERVVIGTDVEAAFHDGFGSGSGVLVIAGTGSIVWARDAVGRVHRVGGWGRLLGDEGSGHWLGMQGLRLVTRAEDGRAPATALRSATLTALGLDAVGELVAWVESASKAEIAALAPIVVGIAGRGDEGAQRIVDAGVAALRGHVEAVLVAMGMQRAARPALDVILWGGLLAGPGPLRGRVETAFAELGVNVVARDLDPPRGAARLALATRSG